MFRLPPLPYAYDALAPVLSEDTLRTHHDKHHAKYVETVNELAAAAGLGGASLEDVVRAAADRKHPKLLNNAGQAWNHGFFWECMTPQPSAPSGGLSQAIDRAFGGLEALGEAFVEEGADHFGSGWVWLTTKGGELSVISTHDGENVLTQAGTSPVLVCDLWEHAYYLDYRNDREDFLKRWWAERANWAFAGAQFEAAQGRGEAYRFPPPMAQAA